MKTTPIEQINTHDKRFCITYPLDDEFLYTSIRKVGIIQPVMVLDVSPRTMVTGFKRLTAAQRLGFREIPCVFLDITERQALLFAIHDNIQRGLNLVEKAHAVDRMLHLGFSSEEVYDVLSLVGLQPHEKIVKTLIALAAAEDRLKQFIVMHGLPMKIVDYLTRFDVNERSTIIGLLSSIRFTESSVREILEILTLLKIKQKGQSIDTLHPANGQELIGHLKEMAFPMLTTLRRDLEHIRQLSALPPNIDIKVDPFFEKEYIDIGIRARKTDDIYQALEKLRRLADDGILGRIFDLTQGNLR